MSDFGMGWDKWMGLEGKLTPGEMAIHVKFLDSYSRAYCTVSILSAVFGILYAQAVPRLNLGATVREPRVEVLRM
jgi:hypothetical protein